ncbi:sigma-70 family RNA polymerase sigma factor [Enterococcus faecalis]|nr:sigma-70 family RNA polymerase sigma factor [Enterococcus faecalis]EGO2739277.1 sigma-70 family RNA polymerase sigma factor [Enterococcus faecalis]EGO8350316.1 sigma-70 family RNA polymerase sigma factor [Enterococcus faecalis]EGO8842580.1 sigma-70 family RNA polymerase sigma factor [Enterococcus faecalis]EGO9476302.1 sigma-70 family RNA polymerase sigma factor [Enterococcus faecalis]EGS1163700.1 sigma-70 family RNA polymerase sigma factor [Enterococcus faecalis]
MTKEREIGYLFICYIQKVLTNEKKNYMRNVVKNRIDLMSDENLLESIEDKSFKFFEELTEFKMEAFVVLFDNVELINAIENLSYDEKFILFERYIAGKKDPSIAKELNITSQAVSKKRKAIIKKLRKSFYIK